MKSLRELVQLLPPVQISGSIERMITDVAYDSRQVKAGALFICLAGAHVDGHDYVADAQARGAVAALVEKDVAVPAGMTIVKTASTRAAMQVVAPYFFDFPARRLRLIGVTGTNGKTTTTHLIRAILRQAGRRVGLMGTIHTLVDEEEWPVKNTTPDVVDLQATLAAMVEAGVDDVVMEVSSHALAMQRTAGCEFDIGVFTNLTRDHLDFHKTFANYIAAKASLFAGLGATGSVKPLSGKAAVINADDPSAMAMRQPCRVPVTLYGVKNPATVSAREIAITARGASFTASLGDTQLPVHMHLTGMFNIYNALAAIGAAQACGVDAATTRTALEHFRSVPGRFESVDAGQPFGIIVDYAHTPDGLENILKTARELRPARLIVVFGCGGDRDRTKRPIMGEIAWRYADVVLVTSDNPRSEDPAAIINEITRGINPQTMPGKHWETIVDRREAIRHALSLAQPHDLVVIAGKGHETYQILADRTIDFDDREVAREIVKELA